MFSYLTEDSKVCTIDFVQKCVYLPHFSSPKNKEKTEYRILHRQFYVDNNYDVDVQSFIDNDGTEYHRHCLSKQLPIVDMINFDTFDLFSTLVLYSDGTLWLISTFKSNTYSSLIDTNVASLVSKTIFRCVYTKYDGSIHLMYNDNPRIRFNRITHNHVEVFEWLSKFQTKPLNFEGVAKTAASLLHYVVVRDNKDKFWILNCKSEDIKWSMLELGSNINNISTILSGKSSLKILLQDGSIYSLSKNGFRKTGTRGRLSPLPIIHVEIEDVYHCKESDVYVYLSSEGKLSFYDKNDQEVIIHDVPKCCTLQRTFSLQNEARHQD